MTFSKLGVSGIALTTIAITSLTAGPANAQSFRDIFKKKGDVPAVTETDLKRAVEGFAKACKTEGSQDLGSCLESKLQASPLGLKVARRSASNSMNYASSLWQNTPVSANACSNGDFSSGQSGWSGYRLQRTPGGGVPLQNYLTAKTPFASNACNQGYGDTCLNIETGGTDPIVSSLNKTYAGQSLVMGGYSSSGYGAEGVARKFVKTSANDTYPFKYAFSMQQSHGPSDSAFFAAIAMDSSGNVVDIVTESADATNPFVQTQGQQYYRDWFCEKLDLSPVPNGDEVLVFFVNSDCAAGGHSGHTYIDDVCEDCGPGGGQGFVGIDASTDSCLDEGEAQTISGTLSVPSGATNLTVDLKVYQNGALVTTVPGASVSGTNYTKTIVRSDFPSLDCFDIVAELSFIYGGSTVTRTSDGANGFKSGQNNDICLNCTPPPPPPPCGDCDTCCPPWSQGQMEDMFTFQQDPAGYQVDFQTNASIDAQMDAWLNYAKVMDPSVDAINILFVPTVCTTNQGVTDPSSCSPTSFFDANLSNAGNDYNAIEWDGSGTGDKQNIKSSYGYPADWDNSVTSVPSRPFAHNQLYTITAYPFIRKTDGTYDFLKFDCPISKMKLNFQLQFGARMSSSSRPSAKYETTTLENIRATRQGRETLERLKEFQNSSASSGGSNSTGTATKTKWTKWYNTDRPGGNGDYQTLKGLVKTGKGCPVPEAIECRTSRGKVDYSQSGEAVTCNIKDGGYCVNKDQKDGRCEDYEVRLLCPAD